MGRDTPSRVQTGRRRANSAHVRQSGPESGPGFQTKVLKPFKVVPSSLGSGATPLNISGPARVDTSGPIFDFQDRF